MDDRCIALNALYAQLSADDGEDRSREDDILAAQVDQPGYVQGGGRACRGWRVPAAAGRSTRRKR